MTDNFLKRLLRIILALYIIILFILLGYIVYQINCEIINKENRNTRIITNIADPENCTRFKTTFFNSSMDYIELLAWVDENMEWVPSNVTMNKRYTDPFKILENGTGRGRCGEHSYVYAAACWAHGYEARLVSAFINGDHAWVEVKIDDSWIHVDPSPPQRVNEPDAYARNFYLFVYAYEAYGSSPFLVVKYNPASLGVFVILAIIVFSWLIVHQSIER